MKNILGFVDDFKEGEFYISRCPACDCLFTFAENDINLDIKGVECPNCKNVVDTCLIFN